MPSGETVFRMWLGVQSRYGKKQASSMMRKSESLGNDMRMYVANSTEAVDFVEMIVDDACFMSRSWASYDLDDDWENRFVKMPSAWECSIV